MSATESPAGSTAGAATAGAPSDRKPVKNADLWQELLDAVEPHRIEWHWVKGHSGHPENDRVDALACAEADKLR